MQCPPIPGRKPRAPRGLQHLGGFKSLTRTHQAGRGYEGRMAIVSPGLIGSGRLARWIGWGRRQ
jgi:hypothetical protein